MPDWKAEIARRLAALRLEPAREAEIAEELAQHLEDRFRELVSGGAAEEQAQRAARQEWIQLWPCAANDAKSSALLACYAPLAAGDEGGPDCGSKV